MNRYAIGIKIDEALHEVLGEVYEKMGITSGDIAPMDSRMWDQCVYELQDIFMGCISYNKT